MGSAMELLTSRDTHRVKQAEVEAKRVVQKAYNEREAATTSLSRYAQSVGNQRKLEAAGNALNAQAENIQKSLDAATTGTLAQRLQAASELGAASVAAAAAGVGGGSVEAYRQTLSLNQAIQEQEQTSAIESDTINAKAAMGNTIRNAVASLNNDQFAGNFDYTTIMDHVKQKNVIGAAIAIGVASYFGGPQAGMATSDAIASGNRFANGDKEGGSALLTSGVARGLQAYQGYQERQRASATDSPLGFTAKSKYTVGGNVQPQQSGFWQAFNESSSYTLK